jgi:hypothetical protein
MRSDLFVHEDYSMQRMSATRTFRYSWGFANPFARHTSCSLIFPNPSISNVITTQYLLFSYLLRKLINAMNYASFGSANDPSSSRPVRKPGTPAPPLSPPSAPVGRRALAWGRRRASRRGARAILQGSGGRGRTRGAVGCLAGRSDEVFDYGAGVLLKELGRQ